MSLFDKGDGGYRRESGITDFMLARIPLCRTGAEFAAFVKAGRKLGDLHCGYEKVEPWQDCVEVKR